MNFKFKKYSVVCLVYLFSLMGSFAQEKINKTDVNGKKEGLWKGYFEKSGRVRYEGVFKNGVEVDTFKYFDDTKAHSVLAIRVFSDQGKVAKTIFYDQKKNKVSEGTTLNRLKEGVWNYYHKESPQLMKVESYKSDILNGKQVVYFPSGKIAEEIHYVNGKKEGSYKVFLENGVVVEESNFVNNQYHGSAIFRDAKGAVASKGNFVNNEKKGVWEFYTDGKLVKKEKFPLRVKFAKKTEIPKP